MAGGSTLLDRVYFNTTSVGTGTLNVGTAKSNAFCTPAESGIGSPVTVTYCIEDGTDFEIGQGVYTTGSPPTMTRATVYLSKIGGTAGTTKITLSGSATVRFTAAKEDLSDTSLFQSGTMAQARLGSGSAGAGAKFLADDQTYKVPTADLVSVISYSTTQTITIPAGATRAFIRMGAPGGGVGGPNGTARTSGGGSGSYLEKYLTGLTPGNTLALTIGAVGAAGANGAVGGTGGNSTLASGTQTISTLTVFGGVGAPAATSSATSGGAGGAVSTGGDFNRPGHIGCMAPAANATAYLPGGGASVGISGTGADGGTGSTGLAAPAGGGCIIEWHA